MRYTKTVMRLWLILGSVLGFGACIQTGGSHNPDSGKGSWLLQSVFIAFFLLMAGCNEDADAHVGSRDCEVIRSSTQDPATHQACSNCQDATCGAPCEYYPCVDNKVVIQGCEADSDCSEFNGALCGLYSAPDKICSFHSDNQ